MRGKALITAGTIAIALLAFGITGAEAGFKVKRVKGSGHLSSEVHEFKNLRGVVNGTWGDIELTLGDENRLEVTMEDNFHEYLDLDVRGGVLKIRFEKGVRIKSRKPMTMKLTLSSLETAVLSGSGDLEAEDLVCEDLELKLSGSGDVAIEGLRARSLDATLTGSGDLALRRADLGDASLSLTGSGDLVARKLEAGNCEVSITGSGDIRVGGKADALRLRLSGSGDADAGKLRCGSAQVRITGSGSGHVQVTDRLKATLTGSGDLRYSGDPRVSRQVTGSGDLIHR